VIERATRRGCGGVDILSAGTRNRGIMTAVQRTYNVEGLAGCAARELAVHKQPGL
jgi:hypothetical protein